MKKILSLLLVFGIMCITVPAALADYAYYVPYYTSFDGNYTGMGIRNCSMAQEAHVTAIVYDRDGNQQLVETFSIPARGQIAYTVGTDLNVEGSMRVTSDQPLAGLVLVLMGQLSYGADIPFTQTIAETIYNPHVAVDNQWSTSVVVNNPHYSPAAVTLTYVNRQGQAIPLTSGTISANGIATYDLAALLGGGSFSGSLEITADQAIAGLVFYSDQASGGSYFSGITAVDPADQTDNLLRQYAVIATTAADFSSGSHSVIPVDEPRIAQNELSSTGSDLTVAAHGQYFYLIERFMADHVTKFDINDPGNPIWQFSTLDPDDPGTSNPYEIIFASDTKAYLLRYATNTVWIVNPSATTAETFKIGELPDLTHYADSDGFSETVNGVIVEDKLFILMQRLTNFVPQDTPYVAVFDTTTDTEIDTGTDLALGLPGIPLPIKNPQAIQYVPENNLIYIQGAGKFEYDTPAEYSGGIISLDPVTYEVTMVVDDGNETDHPYGNISGAVVADPQKGYFIGYAAGGDNTVYAFNPTTGAVNPVPVDPYLSGKNIAGLESGAYADKNGMVWFCNQFDAEVVLVNSATDTIEATVSTGLDPAKVVFCEP